MKDTQDYANTAPNNVQNTVKNTVQNACEDGGITFEVVEKSGASPTRGVYLIPNLITSLSMLAAFFCITQAAAGNFDKAGIAIFVSAILDGMDGRAARMLDAQSLFGEQYDSLADMIAFGLAPSILVYHFSLHHLGRLGIIASFIFVACAAFRLARFNVQIGVVDKKYFIGLASPLAALLVTSSVMVASDYAINPTILSVMLMIWVIVCALLMVSNIKYYSFKQFDRQKVPFIVLMLAVLVMSVALYDIPMGVLSIGVVYALSGLITTLWTHNA